MGLLDLPSLLTVEEVAGFLRLDVLEARRAIAGGDLKVVRLDGRLLIDTHCLLEELGVCVPCLAGSRLMLLESEPEARR